MPVKVRLTRKLAQMINGIDLSQAHPGDSIEVSPRDAELLIKEGWASPIDSAADKPGRKRNSEQQ